MMVFSGRATTNNNKQTTKWLESAHFGLRRYTAQARPAQKSEKLSKLSEKIGKFPTTSERFRTHLDASQRIRTGPYGSEWIRTHSETLKNQNILRNTCKKSRRIAKQIAKNRETSRVCCRCLFRQSHMRLWK